LNGDYIEEGFWLVKKHGIQALGGFMFRFPYDSRETVEQTIAFAKKLSPNPQDIRQLQNL
jgi:radical SAM superfamily enzyme YgiQ (UPF0313 family)